MMKRSLILPPYHLVPVVLLLLLLVGLAHQRPIVAAAPATSREDTSPEAEVVQVQQQQQQQRRGVVRIPDCRIAVVDGTRGGPSSLQLDTNGNPVLAYSSMDSLHLAKCTDQECEFGPKYKKTLQQSSSTGGSSEVDDLFPPALRLYNQEYPVILYQTTSGTTEDLKILLCGTADCSNNPNVVSLGSYRSTLDDGDLYPSVQFNSMGAPVIAIADGTSLRVIVCGDTDCSSAATTTTVVDEVPSGSNGSLIGYGLSLQLNKDGNPVISYYKVSNNGSTYGLYLCVCSDSTCTNNPPTITAVELAKFAGRYSSLQLTDQGNPIISYEEGNREINLAICQDSLCAVNPIILNIARGGVFSGWSQLHLDKNGNPYIAYEQDDAIILTVCDNDICSSRTPPIYVGYGIPYSFQLDNADNPIISLASDKTDWKLLLCGVPEETPPPTTAAPVATPAPAPAAGGTAPTGDALVGGGGTAPVVTPAPAGGASTPSPMLASTPSEPTPTPPNNPPSGKVTFQPSKASDVVISSVIQSCILVAAICAVVML